jgi:hypothetical protein
MDKGIFKIWDFTVTDKLGVMHIVLAESKGFWPRRTTLRIIEFLDFVYRLEF